MSPRQQRLALAAIAAAAALIAGSITGTLLTIDDEAWPGRGGIKGAVQASALFSGYAFPLALAVGILLSATLAPLMRRLGLRGPAPYLAFGALSGLAVHLLVDFAIRERIDSAEDWLGGTVAGGFAGLAWWFAVRRHEERA